MIFLANCIDTFYQCRGYTVIIDRIRYKKYNWMNRYKYVINMRTLDQYGNEVWKPGDILFYSDVPPNNSLFSMSYLKYRNVLWKDT